MMQSETAISGALQDSCLAGLRPAAFERLLEDAHVVRHPAGTVVRRTGTPQAPGLVVEGLLRVFRRTGDGREVTARYVDAGSLTGLATVLGFSEAALPPGLSADAVHDCVVLEFSVEGFQAAMREDPALGIALSRHLFAQLLAAQHALAGSVLLPVRSRVAAHLLDLAERRGSEIVVRATPRRAGGSDRLGA